VTAAEALTLAIMYTDQRRPNYEAQEVSETLASLRDRLKEEEEFREAAMEVRAAAHNYMGCPDEESGIAYNRLRVACERDKGFALRAVSKEPPGDAT
jgi:hypothetical protein